MRSHLVEEHAVPVFRRKEHPLRGGALDVVVHRVLHLRLRSDLLAVHPERQLVAPAHDREMVPASVRHRRAARNGRPRQRGREPSLGRQEHRHLRVARELLSTRERRHKTRVEGEGEVAPRRQDHGGRKADRRAGRAPERLPLHARHARDHARMQLRHAHGMVRRGELRLHGVCPRRNVEAPPVADAVKRLREPERRHRHAGDSQHVDNSVVHHCIFLSHFNE